MKFTWLCPSPLLVIAEIIGYMLLAVNDISWLNYYLTPKIDCVYKDFCLKKSGFMSFQKVIVQSDRNLF